MLTSIGFPKSLKQRFYSTLVTTEIKGLPVSFKYENSLIIGTRDVFSKTPYVIFDVIGKLKWVEE